MTIASRTCTVFSSITRAPASHARTMFCASCVCGPAEGPSGAAARRPWISTGVFGKTNARSGRSKMLLFRSSSSNARATSVRRPMGLSAIRELSGGCDRRPLTDVTTECDAGAPARTPALLEYYLLPAAVIPWSANFGFSPISRSRLCAPSTASITHSMYTAST